MNQEIIPDGANYDGQSSQDNVSEAEVLPYALAVPPGTDTAELDPRNYQYLPSCWTTKIRAAGRITNKSDTVASLFC